MSEEEFGLTSCGPITLPCDSAFMDYIYHFANQERYSCWGSSQSVAPLNSFMLLFNIFIAQRNWNSTDSCLLGHNRHSLCTC
ncbi:hypothetical protein MTR67_050699 [Solanum verrucosum]|uniref:Uncharacterized protein n=1 Tax=Solanum verrucosum TaxID=315347 RepID=A0AAF0V505_SOLVR|nr:hypothetical protein MTR67_050699 [Solanum verrucosum]